MKTYNVKEISEMLNTNPETVRRWIRTGKLKATQDSRKGGNVVTEPMLKAFLKTTPKYAAMASTVFSPGVGLSVLTASLIGGLLSQQHIEGEKAKNAKISAAEVRKLLEADILDRKKSIERKKDTIQQLQSEIDAEQLAIDDAMHIIEEIGAQELSNWKGMV